MSAHVKITVTMEVEGTTLTASESDVRLGDDDVQCSAAGLAYGMVESAWGLVPED